MRTPITAVRRLGLVAALALALPAVLAAKPVAEVAQEPDTVALLEDRDVSVSRLQQLDPVAGWTSGANVSQAEGTAVPFRLEMDARRGPSYPGDYVVEIEYTATVSKSGVVADGYVGLDAFELEEDDEANASIVDVSPPVSGGADGNTTTEYRTVVLRITADGPFVLAWTGELGVTGGGSFGPASVSGAVVHMRHRGSGRNVATQTNAITPANPCLDGFCDPVPGTDPDPDPGCTVDCGGDGPGEGGVPPGCTVDCGGEAGEGEDPPSCHGGVVVETVDAAGANVGPSTALVGSTDVVLVDGLSASQPAACGEVLVALTSVPAGYAVTGGVVATVETVAASNRLASEVVTVSRDSITEVTFVLAAVRVPDSPTAPTAPADDEPLQDPGPQDEPVEVPTGDSDDPADGGTDVEDDTEDHDPEPGDDDVAVADGSEEPEDDTGREPSGGVEADEDLPAPTPTSDPAPDLDALPRTGTEAPVLLLVAVSLLACGAVTLRASRRQAPTGR